MTEVLDTDMQRLIATFNTYNFHSTSNANQSIRRYLAMFIDDDAMFDTTREDCWYMYYTYMSDVYNSKTIKDRHRLPFDMKREETKMFRRCVKYMCVLDRKASEASNDTKKSFYYRVNPHRLSDATMCYMCKVDSAISRPFWVMGRSEHIKRICILCFSDALDYGHKSGNACF